MKNDRSLSFLFTANAISGFAQGISMLAIPWYFNTQHASQYFNIGYGIITILIIFWGLYAGALVDRHNRKNVFLYLNLVCGFLFTLIALIGMNSSLISPNTHALLIMSVFAATMFNYNIHYPALYALGQEITTADSYGSFNSKIEVVGQSVSILSGGIAAFMLGGIHANQQIDLLVFSFKFPFELEPWSIDFIILINAFCHLLAVGFIFPIAYKPSIPISEKETLKKRLTLGFTYLKSHTHVLIFGLASYTVFAMLLVEIHAVLPGYIERHLKKGGVVFALADAIYAVGALGAGLMVRRVFRTMEVKRAVTILTLITSVFFIWNCMAASIFVTLFMSIILGFTNAGIRVLRLTWLFNHVPNEVMGRVNSIFNMSNLVFRFLLIFLFSLPVFHFENNIRWAYAIMAVMMLISATVLIYRNKYDE